MMPDQLQMDYPATLHWLALLQWLHAAMALASLVLLFWVLWRIWEESK